MKYEDYHRHPFNKFIHFICIPIIVLTSCNLLSKFRIKTRFTTLRMEEIATCVMLINYLFSYGYTAYLPEDSNKQYSEIGIEIKRLVKKFGNRFAIRFSNSFKESFSANSTDIMKMVKGESIVCPEQTKQTDNCTTCALCWDCPSKKILFITH